jgi:MFS family permease
MKQQVLFSASLFHALNDAATVTVPMIFPLLYSQQHIITKYSHIGILSNLGLITTLVFQIVVVNHAQRLAFKHIVLFSLTGIALFLSLLTLAQGFFTWLILYLILRAFMSFYHPIGIAIVSKTHPGRGLDFAMGIQSGSGNLGVFTAFISVGYIAQRFDWKAPLYIWAGLALVLGTVCYLRVRGVDTQERDPPKPTWGIWRKTATRVKPLLPGFIFGGACWGTTVYYAPSLFNHKFQASLGETGLILALWIALGAVMPYLFGYLCSKYGRYRIAALGLIGSSLTVAVLGSAWSKGLAMGTLLAYGSFLFLIYPAFQSYVGGRVAAEDQEVGFSLVANVQMLTGALVNLLAGFLSDTLGIHTPFLFLAVLGFMVIGYYALRGPDLRSGQPIRAPSAQT